MNYDTLKRNSNIQRMFTNSAIGDAFDYLEKSSFTFIYM